MARAARADVAAEPEEARGAGVGVLLAPVFVFDFGDSSYVVFWAEHLLQELLRRGRGAGHGTGCVGFAVWQRQQGRNLQPLSTRQMYVLLHFFGAGLEHSRSM